MRELRDCHAVACVFVGGVRIGQLTDEVREASCIAA